jgi:hypothetical protein
MHFLFPPKYFQPVIGWIHEQNAECWLYMEIDQDKELYKPIQEKIFY